MDLKQGTLYMIEVTKDCDINKDCRVNVGIQLIGYYEKLTKGFWCPNFLGFIHQSNVKPVVEYEEKKLRLDTYD